MKRERPLEFLSRSIWMLLVAFGVTRHALFAAGLHQQSAQHGNE